MKPHQWHDFDLAPHNCGDPECTDLSQRGPEGRESEDQPDGGEQRALLCTGNETCTAESHMHHGKSTARQLEVSDRTAEAILDLVATDRTPRAPGRLAPRRPRGRVHHPARILVRQRCQWCGAVLID